MLFLESNFANTLRRDRLAQTRLLDIMDPKYEKDSDTDPRYGNGAHDVQEGFVSDNADQLQRHLNNRQIQLIAIGGSIGTALFVSIGTGLYNGGAGNLFLAYLIQSLVLACVNNSVAEMSKLFHHSRSLLVVLEVSSRQENLSMYYLFLCLSNIPNSLE